MSLKIYRRLETQTEAQNTLIATLPDTDTEYLDTPLTAATPYVYTFQREAAGKTFDPVVLSAETNAAPANQAPTANGGTDQSITLPANSVTLNGSGTDSDGTIAAYAWSKVSGGAATITTPAAASTTVTGLVEGVYVFRLTVTDNGGLTATDEVTITVNPAESTPGTAPTGLEVDSLSGQWFVTDEGTPLEYQINQPAT